MLKAGNSGGEGQSSILDSQFAMLDSRLDSGFDSRFSSIERVVVRSNYARADNTLLVGHEAKTG